MIVSKVIGNTIEELEGLTDRLAIWIESAMAHKENLSIQFSELVVDFIRDEYDQWHMIQVSLIVLYCHIISDGIVHVVQLKGFRVTTVAKNNIQRWIAARDDGLEDDFAIPKELEGNERAKESNIMEQVIDY